MGFNLKAHFDFEYEKLGAKHKGCVANRCVQSRETFILHRELIADWQGVSVYAVHMHPCTFRTKQQRQKLIHPKDKTLRHRQSNVHVVQSSKQYRVYLNNSFINARNNTAPQDST